jgi:hypothetical protein
LGTCHKLIRLFKAKFTQNVDNKTPDIKFNFTPCLN